MATADTKENPQPHGDLIVFVLKWIDEIAHPDWIKEVAASISATPGEAPLHHSERIESIINYAQASRAQAAFVKKTIMAIHGA